MITRFSKNRTHLIGEPPGSVVFIGNKRMEQSRFRMMVYNNEELDEFECSTFSELVAHFNHNKINWVNVDGLHDTEMIGEIGRYFKLSPLVQAAVANTDQRPKMIEIDDQVVFFMKQLFFSHETKTIHSEHMTLIAGANFIITFQESVGVFFDPIRERIRQNAGKIRTSNTGYLCYRILDAVADNYLMCIGLIGEMVEEIEGSLLSKSDKNLIRNIYKNKTEISFIRKAIRPAKEVTTQLRIVESKLFNKNTQVYLRELDDLLTHALETVEIYHSMVSDQLNVHNTNLNNKANEVMKVLTVFTSIFIPLTFLTGVYGTNFKYLPELEYKYSYFILWGVMLIVVMFMLRFFRKKRWL